MRIISGKHKGRQFNAPKKLPVRPTTDKAKEGLFNVLQHEYDFQELRILDLFAGTGNISYEFLSRGVAEITAVDSYAGCVKYIQQMANLLGGENITTHKSDVFKFLSGNTMGNYHLIFADPPYDFSSAKLQEMIALIFEKFLLDSAIGMLIIEHSNKISLQDHPKFYKEKVYENSIFSFFEG